MGGGQCSLAGPSCSLAALTPHSLPALPSLLLALAQTGLPSLSWVIVGSGSCSGVLVRLQGVCIGSGFLLGSGSASLVLLSRTPLA
jgi:hypothetical protein